MTKRDFLEQLRTRLSVLNDNEVDDIIREYEDHIQQKVSLGKTEEEAITDFGDFNELVNELLGAYKIKTNHDVSQKNFMDKQKHIFQYVTNITVNQIFSFLLYLGVTVLIIAILRLPFQLFKYIVGLFFGPFIVSIISILVDISYYLTGFLLLIIGIKRGLNAVNDQQPFNSRKEKRTGIIEQETPIQQQNEEKHEPIMMETEFSERIEKQTKKDGKNQIGIIEMFFGFVIFLMKVFLFVICIPFIIMYMCVILVFGIQIALIFTGIFSFGAFFITIALLIGGASIFEIVYRSIYARRKQYA